MHALAPNNVLTKYPYSRAELARDNPNVSFPAAMSDADLAEWGVYPVQAADPPAVTFAQRVDEGTPARIGGVWVQTWQVIDLTEAELQGKLMLLQQQIVEATQERLDAFARTRRYDGILSACSYATSTDPVFSAEGQYCVQARDTTWSTLYAIQAAIEQGQRPIPEGYADIEPELPVLAWPAQE